jgi:hypothetical protein
MDDVFGLLAFVSLIAAQFLAVVVAYSDGFDNDLLRGKRFATSWKCALPRKELRQRFHPLSPLWTLILRQRFRTAPANDAVAVDAANSAPISTFRCWSWSPAKLR